MAEPLVDRVVRSQRVWLDPLGKFLQRLVNGFYGILGTPGRWLKSLLHGTYIPGHPLHPIFTDVPLGAWTLALVADIVSHYTSSVAGSVATFAIGVGLLGAVLSALTGYTDYADLDAGQETRTGTAHALLMVSTTVLYLISWLVRINSGSHSLAVVLSVLGFLLLTIGAYIGGHLVFARGVQVNFNAHVRGPQKWSGVGAPADFPEGVMKQVKVNNLEVLLVRLSGELTAVLNTCSHAGGPLHEGTREGQIIVCPWHGSRFDLRTGRATCGPATAPQPAFEVREQEGTVELRRANAG